MSRTTSNVNITTDNFQVWVDKTNELRYALQTEVVTANSTLGNTSGNSHVNGFLAANTIVACGNIMGGTIAANGLALPQITAANLNFVSNGVFTCNTFFNSGTVITDSAVGNHANIHTFNSNLVANGSHLVLKPTTRLSANGSVATSSQVLSSNGTVDYWRNFTDFGLDSVANTSVALFAFANSVKTAYDAAVATTIATVRTFNANVTFGANITVGSTTQLIANGGFGSSGQVLTSDGTKMYWGAGGGGGGGSTTVLDSVANTSTTIAAAANSAKTAYDAAIVANTNAQAANTKALDANTRASSAQTAATTAQTDATNANTRAFSAQTAAIAAYSNAVTFAANASNLGNGTVPAARLSGSYTITASSASSVPWTGVTGRPTDLASFTNGPGYITTSSLTAYLRHVTSGYTGSGRVYVSSTEPASPVQGDIWLQI
jgi:hypothetical protein